MVSAVVRRILPMKSEFMGVKRTHIPMQSVIRGDEVEKAEQNKIISDAESD